MGLDFTRLELGRDCDFLDWFNQASYNNIFVFNTIKRGIRIHVQAEEAYFHMVRVS